MVYTDLTVKAMKVAYEAHKGQFDKCGVPYIFHPAHVAESMTDEYSCCAALLHDVAEDTDITLEQLSEEFPEPVIKALRLLTHTDGIEYADYVKALCSDPIARAVKAADLAHNSDPARLSLAEVSPEKAESLRRKYAEAEKILSCSD